MSATTAQQLQDANGHVVVDQYYDSITDKYIAGGNPTSGGLTDTQLRASAVQVDFPLRGGENDVLHVHEITGKSTNYCTVAISQTLQTLTAAGSIGALGDRLASLTITVTTEATSTVSLTDGTGVGTNVLNAWAIWPANMSLGSSTITFDPPLISVTGAWKITTGAGAAVIANGIFS